MVQRAARLSCLLATPSPRPLFAPPLTHIHTRVLAAVDFGWGRRVGEEGGYKRRLKCDGPAFVAALLPRPSFLLLSPTHTHTTKHRTQPSPTKQPPPKNTTQTNTKKQTKKTKKVEGLVHVSNISAARLNSAKDAVQRGQDVWAKVVSVSGARVGLSLRDVDQKTGRDLLDLSAAAAAVGAGSSGALAGKSGLQGISGITVNPADFEDSFKRRGKKLTEAEKWEYKQLMQSGVLDAREHPLYDEEGGAGVLAGADDEAEEELEIDLNDAEPEFLKGHSSRCVFLFCVRFVFCWLCFVFCVLCFVFCVLCL